MNIVENESREQCSALQEKVHFVNGFIFKGTEFSAVTCWCLTNQNNVLEAQLKINHVDPQYVTIFRF